MDNRAYALEWLRKLQPQSQFASLADPTNSGHAARNHLGQSARVLFGMVVDAIPYVHAYRVLLEQGAPPLICVQGLPASAGVVGARPLGMLVPGTKVWCLKHQQLAYGVIIGVEPDMSLAAQRGFADYVHQASHCGLHIDAMHLAPFNTQLRGGVYNWNAGRPFDGLTIGEQGWITETGLRIFVDSFMAQVAVDEATGLFVFYHDQLTRLCGHHLEEFSAGHVREVLDDEGEIAGYEGYTPYPQEQLGTFGAAPIIRQHTPEEVQLPPGHYAAWEPADDRQAPYHRVVTLQGYVGQGGKRYVTAPPHSDGRHLYADGPALTGLFDEQIALTGGYSLSSAHSLTLAKRPSIVLPRRVKLPHDPTGDTVDNYRAAGLHGEGQPHRVAAEPATTAGREHEHLQRSASMLDWHRYLWHWQSVHPLHYHRRDWSLPEPSQTPLGSAERPPRFAELASQTNLPPPQPVELYIDDRYGNVDYYPNTAYLSLLPDGGVVLGDGYGAELRMCGGNLWLDAPGDVFVRSGRNFNVWAGHDAALRARNSLDASASHRDVRIKAQRNLQLLGGNDDDQGGVLIESRSPGAFQYERSGEDVVSGGIQLKAKKGPVVAWARDVYLRTGGGDVQAGQIVLDAAKGADHISLHARTVSTFVSQSIIDTINHKVVNVYSENSVFLGVDLVVDGSGFFTKHLSTGGWIAVKGGHIVTELAPDYNYLVAAGGGRGWDRFVRAFDEVSQDGTDSRQVMDEYFRELYTEQIYGPQRVGNDDVIRGVGFSFRNAEQYRTENFELWEARWQQLARLFGGSETAILWDEKPVRAGAAETYPYPGREAWTENAVFHAAQTQLCDPETGLAQPRERFDLYELPFLFAGSPELAKDAYNLPF